MDKFTKATIQGNIDDIMNEQQPLELSDLGRKDHSLVKCVLVQGAPGVGKTVMANELCKQWAEGNLLQEYSLLVLLTLRYKHLQKLQVTEVDKLFDHPDKGISSAVAKFVSRKNGEDTAFLLDGFDELPNDIQEDDSSIFVRLIKRNLFSNACVIITSRPSASYIILKHFPQNYQQFPQEYQHVEVLGFTGEEINNFVTNRFDNVNERTKFESYLNLHLHIRALMYIPLNCHIIIEVYQSCKASVDSIVPTTQTQLYHLHTLTILNRHLKPRKDFKKMEDIPTEHKTNLDKLSELAYDGIVERPQKLIFDEGEIPKALQGSDAMGFMYVQRAYLSASYNFLHLTIQEFLAAYYISTLKASEQVQPSAEQEQKIRDSIGKRHLEIMLRFYAGLSCIQQGSVASRTLTDWLQTHYDSDPGRRLEYLHWMFEAQDQGLIRQVLGNGTRHLDLSGQTLSPFDCYVLGYCIAKSYCQWKLECRIGEEGMKMLSRGSEGCLRNVQVIDLSQSDLKVGVEHLGN